MFHSSNPVLLICFAHENHISIQNDDFDGLLYDIKWHQLPLDLQKAMISLIHRKQNNVKLTVGPFGSINRNLFKIVSISNHITIKHVESICCHKLRSIYSFQLTFITGHQKNLLLCDVLTKFLRLKKSVIITKKKFIFTAFEL